MSKDIEKQLQEELASTFEALRDAQAALRDLSARVLLDPDAEEEAESARRTQLDRRRELMARVGTLVLRWLDLGGRIDLREPGWSEPAVEPTPPAPAPEAAVASQPQPPAAAATEAAGPVASPASPPIALPDAARLLGALGPAWARRTVEAEPAAPPLDVELLSGILTRLGPPPSDLDDASMGLEVERLAAEVLSVRISEWPRLPKRVQRQLVAMAAARARHVQERISASSPLEITQPLARIFSALTRYSSNEQPGFVVGLQRDQDPRGESWPGDARDAYEALRAELPAERTRPKPTGEHALKALRDALRADAPATQVAIAVGAVLDADVSPDDPRLLDALLPRAEEIFRELQTKARFKHLRRALRDRMLAEEDEADDDEAVELPADWPFWASTAGKRAVVIGGDLREEARQRLERTFRFMSLRWVTTDHSRGAQQLAQSITSGSVDIVLLLLRFIGHDIQDQVVPACKQAGVTWIPIERGYGVTQVRLAIERFLAGHRQVQLVSVK